MLEIIVLGAGVGFFVGFFVGAIIFGGSDGNIMGVILGAFCAPVGVIVAVLLARSVKDSRKKDPNRATATLALKLLFDDIVRPNIRLFILCLSGALLLSFTLSTFLYLKSIDVELSSWTTERWWSRQIGGWLDHVILTVLLGWPAFRYILRRSQSQSEVPDSSE